MNKKRKLVLMCVLAVEILILFFVCAARLEKCENDQIVYSSDMLSMAQDKEEGLVVREGKASIEAEDQGLNRRIITPPFTVRRGDNFALILG